MTNFYLQEVAWRDNHTSEKMPGLIKEDEFKTITVKELHPTFAAEVSGVNFQDLSEEQLSEILAAMAKVGKKQEFLLPAQSL